jgi:hypothetical protein
MNGLLGWLVLAAGIALDADPAAARTPPAVCRTACAARIEADCGTFRGKDLKRCRRGVVRACRRTSPAVACALPERPERERPGPGEPGRPDGGSSRPAPRPAPPDERLLARVKDAVTDRFLEFGSSAGSSGNDRFVTRVRELTLCGFGRFRLRDLLSFSSPDLSLPTEHLSFGTWSVRAAGGQVSIELRIDDTDDQNAPPVQLLPVELDADGSIVVDGERATVEDRTAVCAEAAGDPRAGEATAALADRALGIRHADGAVTEMILCGFGRFALREATAAAELRANGTWAVRVEDGATVLELTLEEVTDPSTDRARRFTLAVRAGGGVLLDGIAAETADVAADCAAAAA